MSIRMTNEEFDSTFPIEPIFEYMERAGAECTLCGHEWTAVVDEDTTVLYCPKCDHPNHIDSIEDN